MEQNEKIALISKQIEKLDDKELDFEAWKSTSLLVLEKIFGNNDSKIRHLESIRFDFGSWSLRDSTGSVSHIESCKRRAKEILNNAIYECQNMVSSPIQKKGANHDIENNLRAVLQDNLKGAQFNRIKEILESGKSIEMKKSDLQIEFNSLKNTELSEILIAILLLLKL